MEFNKCFRMVVRRGWRRAARVFLLLALLPTTAWAGDGYPSLWESRDEALQRGLEQVVQRLGLEGAVAGKRLAIALVDISDPRVPRLAEVNGDRMFYAASLPKIAILFGALVRVQEGDLEADERLWSDLERMIRHSDNPAATRVLRRVGHQELLEILQRPEYMLYDPSHGGGLWVGKEYGKRPAYRRDPVGGKSHGATALQVARLFYLMETGRLLNPELTARMKAILADPAISHKFVKGLKHLPQARIHRKSGTWREFHADGALVEEEDHAYIMVALARDPKGGDWLVKLAAPLRSAVLQRGEADR